MTTVYDMLVRASRLWPDAIATIDESEDGAGARRTYTQLLIDADELAAGLISRGFQRGEAIALYLPNCAQWPTIFFAAAKIGLLVVPLNTRYRAGEIYHLLRTSGARALFIAPRFDGIDFGARLVEMWAQYPEAHSELNLAWVFTIGSDLPPTMPDTVRQVPFTALSSATGSGVATSLPNDPLVVFGTSGTTSAPKLAVHTHRTVASHGPAVADREDLSVEDVQLNVLSLNGTFGFVPFIAGVAAGSTAVLLPAFDQRRIVDAIASHGVSYLVCAEGPLRDLLANHAFRAQQPGRLRTVVTAGTAIDDIVSAASELGIAAVNVYGSSELFAFTGKWPATEEPTIRAIPGGRLVDDAMAVRAVSVGGEHSVLPAGELGELEFLGETTFIEYLNNPSATAAARTDDGWFRTGDLGLVGADGRSFEYRSRLGDSMRLKGYLVNPADIESTLRSHPGVITAHVVGVGDDRSGDDHAVAFVQLRADCTVDESGLVAHCRKTLASFKIPTRIVLVEEYPVTPSANGDKVRKDVLRERAQELLNTAAPAI
jgi:fatty-acyl-CoA synthase